MRYKNFNYNRKESKNCINLKNNVGIFDICLYKNCYLLYIYIFIHILKLYFTIKFNKQNISFK